MPIIGEYEYMKFVQILSTKIMKLDIVVNPKKKYKYVGYYVPDHIFHTS
jgi:hypothetical protein